VSGGCSRVREKKSSAFFRVFSFFVLPPPKLQNYPLPLVLSFEPIFIVKCCPAQNWSFNFFFFYKFWFFLFFLVFFKTSNINVDSRKKIKDFKNNAWKVKRVRKLLKI
jgi:hypothetical protein